MTSFEQLQQLQDMGVDFAGLIFYEASKRFMGNSLKEQQQEVRNLEIKKVGVFVNAGLETIKRAVEDYGLSYVQLHGDESPEFCEQIQNFVSAIKAIQVGPGTDLDEHLEKYKNVCDYFLFDTASKHYGGSGVQFDWGKLEHVNIAKPFFLSGGIGLEDVENVKAFSHPMLYAIDVNSRFEVNPGVKDLQQVASFLKQIN